MDLREGEEVLAKGLGLAGVPDLLRAEALFPFVAGLRFVEDLHRRGGFGLVNAAFSRPPISTEQVLHPERYLADDMPVEIVAPSPPSGFAPVMSGTLGELGIRVLLKGLAPSGTIVGEGWGGDAYSIVESPGKQTVLLWSTAWDTIADADKFVTQLDARWRPRWDAPDALKDYSIKQKGKRVVAVRGLPASECDALVTHLWQQTSAH
jgi:hypothetical protein